MHSVIQRALAVCALVGLSSGALAQFDVQWLAFAQDNSRLQNPNGSPATHVTGDTVEKDMAWGDLDHDGWTDLVIVRKSVGTTFGPFSCFLLMNSNGILVDRTAQYAAAADVSGDTGFLTATNNRDVVIVDLNNDTWLDVVTCTTLSASLPKHRSHPRVYMNLGSSGGTWLGLRFENNRFPTLASAPDFCGVDAGDVDGDGFADLYFADYGDLGDKLLLNDGTGNFADTGTQRLTFTMLDALFGSAARIVDMNGDGWKDIVRSSGVTGTTGAGPMVSVAYNDPTNPGHFPFSKYQPQVGGSAPYHVDVGDLNNDNKPDFITADDGADAFRYNLGNDLLQRVNWGPVKFFGFVAGNDDGFAGNNLITDLDNDGWNDALISDVDVDLPSCATRLHIYHNPGGTVGSEIILKEEAGTTGWRGAVGLLPTDLTGTYDTAAFDIDNDGDKDLVIGRCPGTFVWMNQTNQPSAITGYCFGDGTSLACPCAAGSTGNGCPSSVSAAGGHLAGTGLARISLDTLVLTNTLVPNGPGLYYQGAGQTDFAFGDGKLCAGTGIVRMGIVFSSGGTSSYPGGLTPNPIHIAGGTAAGDVRHYQTWYRDAVPGFCTPTLFNLTNAVTTTWVP